MARAHEQKFNLVYVPGDTCGLGIILVGSVLPNPRTLRAIFHKSDLYYMLPNAFGLVFILMFVKSRKLPRRPQSINTV